MMRRFLAVLALLVVGLVNAQSSDWDITPARDVVFSLVAVGVVITVALVVYGLSVRASSQLDPDLEYEYERYRSGD